MSHTISNNNFSCNVQLFTVTVVNYTAVTGESFTLQELQLGPLVTRVQPIISPSSRNSLGSLIFPVFQAGVLTLFRFVGGVPTEVPTTVGLNAIFDVILVVIGQ